MAGVKRLVPFQREHTGDVQADRQQEVGNEVARTMRRIPWLQGILIDGGRGDGDGPGVTINSSATTINHGLGRVPRGFLVIDERINTGALKWASTQPADQMRSINLQSAADGTVVKIWIW